MTKGRCRPRRLRLESLENRSLLSVATLVTDINPDSYGYGLDSVTNVNGVLFFSGGVAGDEELWKYDGGTLTKIDINPSGGSSPYNLTNVGGTLYFSAYDGTETGWELWKYEDGAAVKIDVNGDPSKGSAPECLTDVNGTLYFTAYDSAMDRELWRYDGSAATKIDLSPSGSSWPLNLTTMNGNLYFDASRSVGFGRALWRWDGATATEMDMGLSSHRAIAELTPINGTLFFAGDGGLYECDGSTVSLIDLNPDFPGSWDVVEYLTNVNGTLYFSGSEGTFSGTDHTGWELWKYDGGTPTKLTDINPSGDSYPTFLTNVGGTLYFDAYDGSEWDVWKWDGAIATKIDINPTENPGSEPYNLTSVNGALFFSGWDGTDWEVWTVDGSTASKIDVNPLGSSWPSDFTAFGGTVYFIAYRTGDGWELFRLDPDPANTAPTLGNATLAAVAEDTLSPPGATVASLFVGEFADPDTDSSLSGIAVVGNTADAAGEGVWQYSSDGTHWANIGSVNDRGAALSLASTTLVRFLPAEDYNGTPSPLVVRGMDDTYAGGFSLFDGTTETRVTVDTTAHGGTTPLADATATLSTSVTSVVDPPKLKGIELAALPYTENDPATAISDTILVTNESGSSLSGAVIQITGNYQKGQDLLSVVKVGKITGKWNSKTGTLTLSGTDTVANYQTALRSVTYQNTSENPSSLERIVTLQVIDGKTTSNQVTRRITVMPVNDPPVLDKIGTKPLTYKEKQKATAVSSSIKVSDADHTTLVGATVQIDDGYNEGQDVLVFTGVKNTSIAGMWDPETGTMTLTGNDTVANYQKALRAVRFQTGVDPGDATRTVSFTTNDGADESVAATRTIVVTPVNDTPALGGIETTALNYVPGQAPTAISGTITVADVDNAVLASATVQITGGYKKGQDFLAFEDTDKITAVFDAKKGLLTLTSIGDATVADFEAALRSVTYQNTSETPKTGKRTVTFKVSDGAAWSKSVKRTVQVTTAAAANDAALLAMFGSLGDSGAPLGRTDRDP